jgi:hypothetical protein
MTTTDLAALAAPGLPTDMIMPELTHKSLQRIWAVVQGQLPCDKVTLEELKSFDLLLTSIEMDRRAEWQPAPGLH